MPRPLLRLRHLHLTNLTTLPRAAKIQDYLTRQHLDRKALQSARHQPPSDGSSPPLTLPHPTLLTFTPPPTYTTGRRDINTLTPTQIASLRGIGPDAPPLPKGATSPASFHSTQRGGQTTYHGPGQLVAYLICDLKTHNLTPRTHVRLLEDSVIEAVARTHPRLKAHTTENPGVWVGDAMDGVVRDDDRKLAAVGVRLRRNVSGFGVGVNVETELGWFDRIVACGLPGRKATSIRAEVERMRVRGGGEVVGVMGLGEELARVLAVGLEGVGGEVATKVAEVKDDGVEG